MGLGAPLRWLENTYLKRHLTGRGVEIGALWRRFPVAPSSSVLYMDRAEISDLKRQYQDVRQNIFMPNVIGDAADLPFAPGTLDFLIASHVLEHLPFPLAALKDWHDALTPGGRLLIRVPDKRYTFDCHRQRTSLSHFVAEYERPELTDWNAHYADWVENVDHRQPTPQEIIEGGEGLRTARFNIHFHVWIAEDIMDVVEFTKSKMNLEWNPRVFWKGYPWRKEVTLLLIRGA